MRQISRIWLRLRKNVLALMRRTMMVLMERFKKFCRQFGVLVLACRSRFGGGIGQRLRVNMMRGVALRGRLEKQVGLVQLLGLIWGVGNVSWVVQMISPLRLDVWWRQIYCWQILLVALVAGQVSFGSSERWWNSIKIACDLRIWIRPFTFWILVHWQARLVLKTHIKGKLDKNFQKFES